MSKIVRWYKKYASVIILTAQVSAKILWFCLVMESVKSWITYEWISLVFDRVVCPVKSKYWHWKLLWVKFSITIAYFLGAISLHDFLFFAAPVPLSTSRLPATKISLLEKRYMYKQISIFEISARNEEVLFIPFLSRLLTLVSNYLKNSNLKDLFVTQSLFSFRNIFKWLGWLINAKTWEINLPKMLIFIRLYCIILWLADFG